MVNCLFLNSLYAFDNFQGFDSVYFFFKLSFYCILSDPFIFVMDFPGVGEVSLSTSIATCSDSGGI